MKRGKKLILLTAVLLLLIGGTFLARSRTTKVVELEEAEESTVLYQLNTDELSAISWTDGDETISLLKNGDTWSLEGDADFPLSTAKADTLAANFRELRAEKTIDNPDALSTYGLEDPSCSITITAETEMRFELGSEKSMDGYLYLSVGDGKIYLVDSALLDSFSCGLYDLVRKESLPDMSDMISLTVHSEVQDYEIDHIKNSGIAYTDQYEWFLKDGDNWLTLDTSLTEEFADQVRILAWQECVNYRADAEALSAYGLDVPAVTAELRYRKTSQIETDLLADDGKPIYDTVEEEKQFTLEIGDYTDSGCYARIAESPMVYIISSSVCDELLYMSYDDLRPNNVIMLDMNELTKVDVSVDGETSTFMKTEQTVTDEEGNSSTETVYLLDDRETPFSEVLYSLGALLSDNYAGDEAPKRSRELTFVFYRDNDRHPETELIFYSYDSSNCLVTLDGESTVFIDRYSVDSLKEKITNLMTVPQ